MSTVRGPSIPEYATMLTKLKSKVAKSGMSRMVLKSRASMVPESLSVVSVFFSVVVSTLVRFPGVTVYTLSWVPPLTLEAISALVR